MLKSFLMKTGVVLVLLSVFFFASCKQTDDDPGVPTKQIRITGLPAADDANYKIYVQVSKGMNQNAGNIAESELLLAGGTDPIFGEVSGNTATFNLKEPKVPVDPHSTDDREEATPLASFNVAVMITPHVLDPVPTADDVTHSGIKVHAYIVNKSSEIQELSWGTPFMDLDQMPGQKWALIKGILLTDTEIYP